MNIETIIQKEGAQSEVNKGWDFLNATTAGHIGHFAGNPAHASIYHDFNRIIKILDVTADKFTPLNKHTESHQK